MARVLPSRLSPPSPIPSHHGVISRGDAVYATLKDKEPATSCLLSLPGRPPDDLKTERSIILESFRDVSFFEAQQVGIYVHVTPLVRLLCLCSLPLSAFAYPVRLASILFAWMQHATRTRSRDPQTASHGQATPSESKQTSMEQHVCSLFSQSCHEVMK